MKLNGEADAARRETLEHLFDKKAFCEQLKQEGMCFECSDFPRTFANADRGQFEKAVLPSVCNATEETYLKSYDDAEILTGQETYLITGKDHNEYVRFARKLQPNKKLAQIIDRMSSVLGSAYVGVHMRVEEDWKRHGYCYVSAENIVEKMSRSPEFIQLKELVRNKTNETLKIFVASGAKELSRKAWAAVEGVEVVDSERETEGLTWNQKALVDLELCRRSTIYAGTRASSSFSDIVRFMRADKMAFAYGNDPHGAGVTLYGKFKEVPKASCFVGGKALGQ